jgi:O-methyltransferase
MIMQSVLISIDTIQFISIVLILIFFLIGFKILETSWSFKISKPWQWEQAVKSKEIDSSLLHLERSYRDKVRFYTFWFQIERLKSLNIPGAFAELGVYKGETARMFHAMDSSREIFLFDTFDGFNEADLKQEDSKDSKYSTRNFSDTSLESVKKQFAHANSVHFFPGYFPETTIGLKEQQYAFVHLDADLYLPTSKALAYFYSRLSPGGIIIIHDYNHTWNGVTQAVDEFAKSIPEQIIPIADWQGSVLLVKNV